MLGLDQRAARYTWTAVLILLALYIAYLIRDTLFLFVVSLLFAYLLYPLVRLVDRFFPNTRRGPALAIVYIALVGILVLLGIEFGSRVADEAAALSKRAPEFLQKLRSEPHTAALPRNIRDLQQTLVNTAQNYLYNHYNQFVSFVPRVTVEVLKASTNLIYVVIVPILSFFLLKDGLAMRDEMLSLVDTESSRVLVQELMSDVHELLLQYMRALFTLCAITLVAFAIALSALSVPYPILLAFLAFPLEFIPLLGPLVAAVVIIVVSAFSGYTHLLWLVIFLGAYRLCQDYVVSPRLMSAGVELHPLLVILGVFAGGEMGGVRGAVLSVPVIALLRVVYKRIRMWRFSQAQISVTS